MSEATSNGMSAGTGATWLWWTTTCSAKAPMRMPWTMLSPPLPLSGLCRSSGKTSSQNTGAPPAQEGQKPQERISVATTGSPTLTRVTPGPTASTIARRLVAIDRRQIAAPGALPIEDVAVADRAGLDLDADLALAGLGEVDLLDRQRLSEGAADRGAGFHGRAPDSGERRRRHDRAGARHASEGGIGFLSGAMLSRATPNRRFRA